MTIVMRRLSSRGRMAQIAPQGGLGSLDFQHFAAQFGLLVAQKNVALTEDCACVDLFERCLTDKVDKPTLAKLAQIDAGYTGGVVGLCLDTRVTEPACLHNEGAAAKDGDVRCTAVIDAMAPNPAGRLHDGAHRARIDNRPIEIEVVTRL